MGELSAWLALKDLPQAHCEGKCNRNPETRQKLCGAVWWYRAAVVQRLWRRRPIPETRVRSSVATHLLASLNLPVSSLAPDSNWIPVTLVAEDGLEARASKPSSATSLTGIQLESGAREETGRFRDAKRCVATEDRTPVSGIGLLRHNRYTTAARYHRTAPQSF